MVHCYFTLSTRTSCKSSPFHRWNHLIIWLVSYNVIDKVQVSTWAARRGKNKQIIQSAVIQTEIHISLQKQHIRNNFCLLTVCQVRGPWTEEDGIQAETIHCILSSPQMCEWCHHTEGNKSKSKILDFLTFPTFLINPWIMVSKIFTINIQHLQFAAQPAWLYHICPPECRVPL